MTRTLCESYTADFKAEVAIAALVQTETLAQLEARFDLDLPHIEQWRARLAEGAESVFSRSAKKVSTVPSADVDELRAKLRQLERENEWLVQQARSSSRNARRAMIDRGHDLSVSRQAQLLSLSRASVYYEPVPISAADLALISQLQELHTQQPFFGSRMLQSRLKQKGIRVGRKHVATLMRKTGIKASTFHLARPRRLAAELRRGDRPIVNGVVSSVHGESAKSSSKDLRADRHPRLKP
jgi:putative transposase